MKLVVISSKKISKQIDIVCLFIVQKFQNFIKDHQRCSIYTCDELMTMVCCHMQYKYNIALSKLIIIQSYFMINIIYIKKNKLTKKSFIVYYVFFFRFRILTIIITSQKWTSKKKIIYRYIIYPYSTKLYILFINK